MTETANSSSENQRYNREFDVLDGLREFHPEYFEQLSPEDLTVLNIYYPLDQEIPKNVFAYRKDLINKQPDIESSAHAAFARLLSIADIKTFK